MFGASDVDLTTANLGLLQQTCDNDQMQDVLDAMVERDGDEHEQRFRVLLDEIVLGAIDDSHGISETESFELALYGELEDVTPVDEEEIEQIHDLLDGAPEPEHRDPEDEFEWGDHR